MFAALSPDQLACLLFAGPFLAVSAIFGAAELVRLAGQVRR